MIFELYCSFGEYVSLSCGCFFFAWSYRLLTPLTMMYLLLFYYAVCVVLSCGWSCDYLSLHCNWVGWRALGAFVGDVIGIILCWLGYNHWMILIAYVLYSYGDVDVVYYDVGCQFQWCWCYMVGFVDVGFP